MPFRQRAQISLTNESQDNLSHLFYDVDLLLGIDHPADACYFHAHWRRENPNVLGKDFTILPQVRGRGRYLGCNVGVIANPIYGSTWWGEGEFKVWLDGDDVYPTLCGTGTEDFIGTAWGQGAFVNRSQGCPIADKARRQWCFYRYHVDDPIYFDQGCRAALQTIGGSSREQVMALQAQGAPLIPVSINVHEGAFIRLMEQQGSVDLSAQPEGWCNFYRQDDWSATSYFYLDRPENDLASLAPVEMRYADLPDVTEDQRADV
jgi:hypothetical protein